MSLYFFATSLAIVSSVMVCKFCNGVVIIHISLIIHSYFLDWLLSATFWWSSDFQEMFYRISDTWTEGDSTVVGCVSWAGGGPRSNSNCQIHFLAHRPPGELGCLALHAATCWNRADGSSSCPHAMALMGPRWSSSCHAAVRQVRFSWRPGWMLTWLLCHDGCCNRLPPPLLWPPCHNLTKMVTM